jgi:hypothetical protein
MPAPNMRQEINDMPLTMVGGSSFGRYQKISNAQTWNFLVSDGFLVPYAGYKNVVTTASQAIGRGLYSSYRGNFMLAVIGDVVYRISTTLVPTPVATLATTTGDVYIAENNNSEIAITDGTYIYVYNYNTGIFSSSVPGAINFITFGYQNPGYISFQNGRLIVVSLQTAIWVLSGLNDATQWTLGGGNPSYAGSLQSKPDFVQAAVPMPGGGNNLLLFGRNVTEQWQQTASALFPYQRGSSFNVDYGCLNASTVASLNSFVVWLAVNEQSGPVIMVCNGSSIKSITTDGIAYRLSNLSDPTNCTAFLFMQDGHLIYQFTFITDNVSYAYDFNTGLFFNVSDPNLNYHIAREVVYFNNSYYFVSLDGPDIYLFDSSIYSATYSSTNIQQIPRIRITPPVRLPNQHMFIIKSASFTMENGLPNAFNATTAVESSLPVFTAESFITLSISRDGGENFGNSLRYDMNPTGMRKNRINFQRLGQANDATLQFSFYGLERFVLTDGLIAIYS